MNIGINTYKWNYGFTLIETMIALVLISLILLTLFSGLFSARKHWEIGQNKLDSNSEIRLVDNFLRKYISQAMPISWIDKDGREILFNGQEKELSFTTELPSHRGGGGVYYITIKMNEYSNSKSLEMYYSLINVDNDPRKSDQENKGRSVTLINNISDIKFTYFGKPEQEVESQWHEKWPPGNILPRLVRLNIHSSPNWPAIDIAIKNTFSGSLPEFSLLSAKKI